MDVRLAEVAWALPLAVVPEKRRWANFGRGALSKRGEGGYSRLQVRVGVEASQKAYRRPTMAPPSSCPRPVPTTAPPAFFLPLPPAPPGHGAVPTPGKPKP